MFRILGQTIWLNVWILRQIIEIFCMLGQSLFDNIKTLGQTIRQTLLGYCDTALDNTRISRDTGSKVQTDYPII